jgi:hypothetical protein
MSDIIFDIADLFNYQSELDEEAIAEIKKLNQRISFIWNSFEPPALESVIAFLKTHNHLIKYIYSFPLELNKKESDKIKEMDDIIPGSTLVSSKSKDRFIKDIITIKILSSRAFFMAARQRLNCIIFRHSILLEKKHYIEGFDRLNAIVQEAVKHKQAIILALDVDGALLQRKETIERYKKYNINAPIFHNEVVNQIENLCLIGEKNIESKFLITSRARVNKISQHHPASIRAVRNAIAERNIPITNILYTGGKKGCVDRSNYLPKILPKNENAKKKVLISIDHSAQQADSIKRHVSLFLDLRYEAHIHQVKKKTHINVNKILLCHENSSLLINARLFYQEINNKPESCLKKFCTEYEKEWLYFVTVANQMLLNSLLPSNQRRAAITILTLFFKFMRVNQVDEPRRNIYFPLWRESNKTLKLLAKESPLSGRRSGLARI